MELLNEIYREKSNFYQSDMINIPQVYSLDNLQNKYVMEINKKLDDQFFIMQKNIKKYQNVFKDQYFIDKFKRSWIIYIP